MNRFHKSSSHVQMQAEDLIFSEVEKVLNIKLDKNPKLFWQIMHLHIFNRISIRKKQMLLGKYLPM